MNLELRTTLERLAAQPEPEIDIEALIGDFDEADNEPAPVGKDSESLKRHREALAAELRDKFSEGLGDEVVRLRRMISETDDLIIAAQIKEAKDGIQRANDRLKEIEEERVAGYEIKKEATAVLDEKVRAMQEANAEVQRVNFLLYQLDSDAESQRDSRRTFRSRIEDLLHDAEQQIGDRK